MVAGWMVPREATVQDNKLLDFGNYPEIDAAGIGDFHLIGDRLRFVLFDWYKIDNVWQRKIVGMAKMPLISIPAASVRHWSGVFAPPAEPENVALH